MKWSMFTRACRFTGVQHRLSAPTAHGRGGEVQIRVVASRTIGERLRSLSLSSSGNDPLEIVTLTLDNPGLVFRGRWHVHQSWQMLLRLSISF